MIPSLRVSGFAGDQLGELGDGADDVGGAGGAQLLLVVRAGERARGDGGAGAQRTLDVAAGVTERGDIGDAVDLESHRAR